MFLLLFKWLVTSFIKNIANIDTLLFSPLNIYPNNVILLLDTISDIDVTCHPSSSTVLQHAKITIVCYIS